MKKLSRILAALLAAVLLFSCSSALAAEYTAPSKVSQIEDLPELPDVPSLKTKVKYIDGEDIEFITITGDLESLSAVWGKATVELDIEDGMIEFEVGELNKKYHSQVGYDTWGAATESIIIQHGDSYEEKLAVTADTTKAEIDAWKNAAKNGLAATKPKFETKKYHLVEKVKDENGRNVRTYSTGRPYVYYDYEPETATRGEYEAYWATKGYIYETGVTPLKAYAYGDIPGVDYAFEGMTEDGVKVLYDRKGRNTARAITVDDANVFGTEEAPETTEFVWVRSKGIDGNWTYHIRCIAATYGNGSTITAWYYGGSLVKAVKK